MKYNVQLRKVWDTGDIQDVNLPPVDTESMEKALTQANELYSFLIKGKDYLLVEGRKIDHKSDWKHPTKEMLLDFFQDMVASSMWIGRNTISEMVRLNSERYGMLDLYSWFIQNIKEV